MERWMVSAIRDGVSELLDVVYSRAEAEARAAQVPDAETRIERLDDVAEELAQEEEASRHGA